MVSVVDGQVSRGGRESPNNLLEEDEMNAREKSGQPDAHPGGALEVFAAFLLVGATFLGGFVNTFRGETERGPQRIRRGETEPLLACVGVPWHKETFR